MKLTDRQRAALDHRGSTLLVSASAGAGKTEVLARRCVALINDARRPGDVERLLVVTFTRAAAAELRVRIGRMLREAARDAPTVDLRRHLLRQEIFVDAAEIGTIDAWCGRTVREHAVEAGVDVDFTVLAAPDARLLRRQVLDAMTAWIQGAEDPLAGEARGWLARAARPDDGFLQLLVAHLSAFREHLVNPEAWFARAQASCDRPDGEDVLAAALRAECDFQREQLQALCATAAPEVGEGMTPYSEALRAWHMRLNRPGELLGVVADIKRFDLCTGRRKQSARESPVIEQIRKRWLGERLQERWSSSQITAMLAHEPATAALSGLLLRLEARYHALLIEAKRARAAYEFADVLRLALDLLGRPAGWRAREPTDVAERLRRRYEHVLVDEYQDTSPVQVEILRLVTRTAPGQTNGFLVGDVKQSIYGFREAEPRLFVELATALAAGQAEGRVQHLVDNFRSHAALLAPLNELFASLFDRRLGGTTYGEQERLRAGRASDEPPNHTLDPHARVQIHVLEQERSRARADEDPDDELVELIEREAQVAADQIRSLLHAGVLIPERTTSGTPVLRPFRLRDVAILLRSAVRKAGRVARVFRLNGIPCLTSSREALLDSVEVRDVCGALELLLNRRQDVPLAAYLRGPFVGLFEAELLEIRTACPHGSADYYEAVHAYRQSRTSASLAAKLDAALTQLDRWAVAAREEELPALLRRILRESDLALVAAAQRGGSQRVALLRALQNFAQDYAQTGGSALDEFVDYLGALATEEIEPAAPAPGEEDAVQLTTIHGAKGLEFPIVFLLGAGTTFNPGGQRRPLLCDEDLGFGLRFSDYSVRATLRAPRQHIIAHRVAQRELEEELRLLYVAATRARERLYVVGHAPPGTWDTCGQLYATGAAPPLLHRLCVRNCLEWVLMAAARLTAQSPGLLDVQARPSSSVRRAEPVRVAPAFAGPPWTPEDDTWVSRGYELIAADVDSRVADLPTVMSVSALKEHALRERTADRPHVLDAGPQPLAPPALAAARAAPDGRAVGTACHRFLELADLGRVQSAADVQQQVAELVAAGRLSAEQGAQVPAADVAWFAGTPEGRLVSGTARREMPFVFAWPVADSGECTIVRGVIDCLIDTSDGLVILDYKTDVVRDDGDLEQRLTGYRVQLQHYAAAARAILARPVACGRLVFLRMRRIVDVSLLALAGDGRERAL